MIDDKVLITKADAGEGLTVEEVKRYQQLVNRSTTFTASTEHLLSDMEEHNVGKLWAIENLPEYLHGIDRQAEEIYEDMRGKLLRNVRYKRTGNFIEDYRRQTEVSMLIEQEILSELVYVD